MSKPITIKILGDASQFERTMKGVNSKLGGISKSLGTAGKVIGAGVAVVGVAAAAIAVDAVQSLMRIEKINAQTDAALQSTGASAWITRDAIEGFAGSIESLTGVEAEAIQEGQNVLLTFANVRNEVGEGNDVFDRATMSAVDMSVALGTDLAGANIMLGKALNDPIAGISAMSRAGVSFTEDQKEMIKTLVESGDTLGAQKIILSEMENQFGGSAEAFGQTTAGKVERLKHAFGTLTEAIVSKLLPPVTKLVDWLLKIATAAEPWAEEMGPKVIEVFETVRDAIKDVVDKVMPTLIKLWDKFTKNGEDMVPVLAAIGAVLAAVIVPAMLSLAVSVVTAVGPVLLVTAAIAALVGGLVWAYRNVETFRNIVDKVAKFLTKTAWPAIKKFTEGLIEAFKSFMDWFKANVLPVIESYIEAAVAVFTTAFKVIKTAVEVFISAVSTAWDIFGKTIVKYITGAFAAIKTVVEGALKILTGIFDLIKAVLTGKWGEAWEAIKKIVTGAIDVIKGILMGVANLVTSAMSAVRAALSAVWRNAWSAAQTALEAGWTTAWNWFKGLPARFLNIHWMFLSAGRAIGGKIMEGLGKALSAAGGLAADLGTKLKDAAKAALNWMIGKLNGIEFRIGWPVNKTVGLPNIPLIRAMGGPAEGIVRVGERGPEEVYLPKGSQVRSTAETGSGGSPITVNVQTNADPFAIANEMAWALRIHGR